MSLSTSPAKPRPVGAATSPIYWICRGVIIEALRRREVSVVLLFMGLFVIGAVTARMVGSESDAAAAFILNLGISLAWFLSILLAILLAARQFPDELESRQLYPLLAKPLSRAKYVFGKWLATALAAGATALVLNAIALAASPWPASLHAGALVQAIGLELIAVAVTAALAILLSIRLPKALAVVITALLVFGAAPAVSLALSRIMPGAARRAAAWLSGYVPNLGHLDLFNSFSAGAPALDAVDFFARIAYGFIIVLFTLGLASFLLERRSL